MKKFLRKSQGSQKIPGVPPEFDFLRKSQGIQNSGGTPGTVDSMQLIQTLFKYFDQKIYREWYELSQNGIKIIKFACYVSCLLIKWLHI